MDRARLLRLIEANVDWLMRVASALDRVGAHVLTRFLPLVDLRTFPATMTPAERRETAVLDTVVRLLAEPTTRILEEVLGVVERFAGDEPRPDDQTLVLLRS